MSPNLWFGAGAVPGILQLGRAQLWFGCILYFYCWTLTLMSLISDQWICSTGSINNLSCLACPSWEEEHGKDERQRALLAVATVLGALGYVLIALRWLPRFARFPWMKLLSMGLLGAVIALDLDAHFSYRSDYQSSIIDSSGGSLFFCTGHSFAEQAGVYGCLAIGLLVWHEVVEWSVRRKMRRRRELRRRMRAQQESDAERPQSASHQRNGTGLKQVVVNSSQPDVNSPAPVPHPPPHPLHAPSQQSQPSLLLSSSQLYDIVVATGSSSSTSFSPSAAAPVPAPTPASRPAPSASAAEWCEWLGLYTRPETKLDSLLLKWTWKDQLSPMQRRLVLGVNAFFLLLYFGGLIISTIEGWALQDGINYILSSWCTLGYGLYTPITTGGRIFMYIYWPVGFIVISSTSTTIWRVILARLDRTLKETTEKITHNHKAQPAGKDTAQQQQQQLQHTDGRGVEQQNEAHQAQTHAHHGDEEEEEEGDGEAHHSSYPALKDIVFTSPSARRSLSQHRSPPPGSDDGAQVESKDEHSEPAVKAERSPGDGRLLEAEDLSTPSIAPLHLSSHSRLSPMQLPSPPSQYARPRDSVTTPARRHSNPQRANGPGRQYAPTASYPLGSGRGHFSLTVYESANEPTPMPSLADVFAPLNADPSAAATGAAHRTPGKPPSQTQTLAPPPALASQPSHSTSGHQPSSPSLTPSFAATSATGHAVHKGVSGSELTMVSSALREDFLAQLRQQTSHEQLQKDIRRQRSATPPQPQQQSNAPRLPPLPEDDPTSALPPPSPQSSDFSPPSPPPAPNPLLINSSPPPPSSSHPTRHSPPSSRHHAHGAGGAPPVLYEMIPLLIKLGIAVLFVICWICLAGGVLVWGEGGQYSYWDCQWSAFNLLTTISVGSLATPFSTETSAFFVWYLLLGVGTLAYCFALIAQLAFIAFDKRQAVHHQRLRDVAHRHAHMLDGDAASGGGGGGGRSSAGRKGDAGGGEGDFVAHAKELDHLILQLVQRQAAKEESLEDAEQQHRAFMRSPVLVLGGGGASGEQVELPLEGVSLLLRYHLAFQAFERERARMESARKARQTRKARQRGSRRQLQLVTDAAGAAGDRAEAGASQSPKRGQGTDANAGNTDLQALDGEIEGDDEDEGEEEVEEEKLAGIGPPDRLFDWSNDTDWIAQAEEESVSTPAQQMAEHTDGE